MTIRDYTWVARLTKLPTLTPTPSLWAAPQCQVPVAWQEAMDHYGDSEANPTPPAAGLPQHMVIQQWLSPVWNWVRADGRFAPSAILRQEAACSSQG